MPDSDEPDDIVVCLTCAVYVRVPAGTDPDSLFVTGRVAVTDGTAGLWPADMTETEASRVVEFDDEDADEDDAGEASDPSPEAACTSSSTSGTGRG